MDYDELCSFRTLVCSDHKTGKCGNPRDCYFSHCLVWPRRNPTVFEYSKQLCPEISFARVNGKMKLTQSCNEGRLCRFAHTKEEQLYHPDFYKTVPCHSSKCQKYCPFLHSPDVPETPKAVPVPQLDENNRFKFPQIPSVSPPSEPQDETFGDVSESHTDETVLQAARQFIADSYNDNAAIESNIYSSSLISDLINIAKLGVHVAESPADDILQSLWKDIENYRNNFSLEELKRIHYSSALEKALISLKISDRGN